MLMPKVSVMVLTKDRPQIFLRALESIKGQTFTDYELVVVNAGTDQETPLLIAEFEKLHGRTKVLTEPATSGVTRCRQRALEVCEGEYLTILDDDDVWLDADKLAKQTAYLDAHPDTVLIGGAMRIMDDQQTESVPPIATAVKFRPQTDRDIRRSMLFRNNFFDSTVMFRTAVARRVGGYTWLAYETAEDYDLALRMGALGKLYNSNELFAAYTMPSYSSERFGHFMVKQLLLVHRHRYEYPHSFLAYVILRLRLLLKR